MKRIAAAIICIVLFVMAPCAALASDTPNTLSENEAMYDSPRDVAISFLNDCAYEMFMYESKGLSNKTVLMSYRHRRVLFHQPRKKFLPVNKKQLTCTDWLSCWGSVTATALKFNQPHELVVVHCQMKKCLNYRPY